MFIRASPPWAQINGPQEGTEMSEMEQKGEIASVEQ